MKEAEEGDRVVPDQILIAPGGRHMVLTGHSAARPRRALRRAAGQRPPAVGRRAVPLGGQGLSGRPLVGIIMTGMGRDGVDGCKAILAAGGLTLGQDEATSVVYGMNKAAFLEGAIKAQFALDEASDIIQNIAAFRAALETERIGDHGHDRPATASGCE